MLNTQKENFWITIICGFAILIGLILFNPFPLYFLNDDLIHIPLSGRGELFQRNSFRPVCDLSIQLDNRIWGKTAWGYHLTNLLLHIADTVLVYCFVRQIFKTYFFQNVFAHALPAATLFFIYAFHSEAVFWIIGRSASLGVLFFLPACIFYLRRNEGATYFLYSLVFFFIGLLTYESVWIFPAVAAVISFTDSSATKRKEWRWIVVIAAVFCIYMVIRYSFINEVVGGYEAQSIMNVEVQRLASNFLRLMARVLFPPALQPVYFFAGVIIGVLVILFLFISMGKKWKDKPLLQLFVPLLLLSLLPYISLGVDSHTSEGERFLYMPSVFAAMFLIRLLLLAAKTNRGAIVFFTVLFAFHLIYLGKSASHYKTASIIVKSTFKSINELQNKNLLIVDSLPQAFRGALMFRSGFEEGVAWLKEPATVETILVHSLKNNNHYWQKGFTAVNMELLDAAVINHILVKGKDSDQYEKLPVNQQQFGERVDARFIYTNESLQVKR